MQTNNVYLTTDVCWFQLSGDANVFEYLIIPRCFPRHGPVVGSIVGRYGRLLEGSSTSRCHLVRGGRLQVYTDQSLPEAQRQKINALFEVWQTLKGEGLRQARSKLAVLLQRGSDGAAEEVPKHLVSQHNWSIS